MPIQIEHQTKLLVELLAHAYKGQSSLDEALASRSIRMLYEATGAADITEEIANTKAALAQLIGYFPADKASKLIAELEKLANAIPEGTAVSDTIFAGDKKEAKELSEKISTALFNATRGADATVGATSKLATALKPYLDKLDDDQKDMPIGALSDEAKLNPAEFKDKFITRDKLEAGITKAFVPSQTFDDAFKRGIASGKATAAAGKAKTGLGKFLSSAVAFLGGAMTKPPGTSFPNLLVGFKEMIELLSVNELMTLADTLSGDKSVQQATTDAAEATALISTAAEQGGGGEAGGGDGGEAGGTGTAAAEKAIDAVETKAATAQVKDTVAGVINAFSSAFKDDDDMKSSVERLRADMRDSMKVSKELISDELKQMFQKWYSSLPQDEKDKFSENNVKDAAETIKKSIDANLKFESKKTTGMPKLTEVFNFNDRRPIINKDNQQIEKWLKMAGIK